MLTQKPTWSHVGPTQVKGQVSGLAVCMVDKEPRIRDAAKVFFHKYSEVCSFSRAVHRTRECARMERLFTDGILL